KTAIKNEAQKLQPVSQKDVSDLCASMQRTIADLLADRCHKAIEQHGEKSGNLVVAGGVAANGEIRQKLETTCAGLNYNLIAPPLELCTDNAAMIAWAGLERFEIGERSSLDHSPRSRWPLDEKAGTLIGSGKKGAKV
ncbi:MAG: tRNA (adenosine(37)-N6)-threonylcarbamoyltransferase complex transferase subunit TsaD, partial [Pseudomonadota bacterium]